MAPIYGFGALTPWEGMKRMKMAFTGKGSFEYYGAWGYKTLMTGVKAGSLASQLSLGNVVLSATELTGKAIGGMFGIQNDDFIKAMSNARQGGLAKLFGSVETTTAPPTKKQRLKLFNDLKKKNKYSNIMQIRKTYKEALSKLKGKTKTTATGLTKFMYWMGGETVGGGTAMIKMGGKGALGIGARAAAGLSGVGTALFLTDILSLPIKAGIDRVESGLTDLATGILQWQKEAALPDFGKGRIPTAMSSSGAATERRRAIQASYSARINPSNRMFGNEARYHHNR